VKIHKLILQGTQHDLSRLEGFCQRLTPTQYAAGTRLRALAVELAKWEELEVAAVAYEDGSLELEVIFALDPFGEPVTIDRDRTGGRCQVSWERRADIGDEAATGKTAQMILALAVVVSCTPTA
jgi:hypothetical protein